MEQRIIYGIVRRVSDGRDKSGNRNYRSILFRSPDVGYAWAVYYFTCKFTINDDCQTLPESDEIEQADRHTRNICDMYKEDDLIKIEVLFYNSQHKKPYYRVVDNLTAHLALSEAYEQDHKKKEQLRKEHDAIRLQIQDAFLEQYHLM